MDDRTRSVNVEEAPTADQDTDLRAQQIRAEIEQTREDLSETVEAIQEKLRPSNIVASAASSAGDRVKELASTTTETVKEMASTTTEKVKDMAHTAAETSEQWLDASGGNRLINKIRNNPMPAMLVGAGLTWLAFSNGHTNRRDYSRYRRSAAQRRTNTENLGSNYETAGSEYGTLGEDYSRSGRDQYSRYGSMRGGNGEGRMAKASHVLRDGRYRVASMIRDYPLAVGAAALLLGASLGMVVPETESENEWLGEARDNAVQRAQEAASGAVERVKDVAADVVTRAAMGD